MGIKLPGFDNMATEIADFTRVNWEPKFEPLQAGQSFFVETIPSFGTPIQTEKATAAGTGALAGLGLELNAAVLPVYFTVTYSVHRNGKPLTRDKEFKVTPLGNGLPTPPSGGVSDPLQVLIAVPPDIVSDEDLIKVPPDPSKLPKYELVVKITVVVEDNTATKEIPIPITLVPIAVPTLLVLTGNNKVFVMVKTGSKIAGVSEAAATLNTVIQTVNSVKNFVGFAGILLARLGDAVSMLTSGGVAGLAVQQADDLDDYDDFDEEAEKLLLLGPVGTAVDLFDTTLSSLGGGFTLDPEDIGEASTRRFQVGAGDDFGTKAGVTAIGFGCVGIDGPIDITGIKWEGESETLEHDVQSCRFAK